MNEGEEIGEELTCEANLRLGADVTLLMTPRAWMVRLGGGEATARRRRQPR